MEKTFDEILASIKKELAELQAMNSELIKENALLRQKCNLQMKKTSKDNVISIAEAFEQFDSTRPLSYKKTILCICKKNGIESISYFQGKKADDLLNIDGISYNSVALFYVICLHYNINLHCSESLKRNRAFSAYLRKYQSCLIWND